MKVGLWALKIGKESKWGVFFLGGGALRNER